MTVHIRPRLAAVCAAALALAPLGCLNPNLYPHPGYAYPPYPPPAPPAADKSAPPPVDNRYAGAYPPINRVQYQQVGDPPPSTPLPPPNPYPANPPGTPPGQQQPQQPQQPWGPQANGMHPLPPTPHRRDTPTNAGRDLPLGPNELPLEKALELAKQMELLAFENKQLIARVRTLESDAKKRESSLNEAIQEVITASDEVVKARTDMQSLKLELAALRERVKQVESQELDTLRKVVGALEKLVGEK